MTTGYKLAASAALEGAFGGNIAPRWEISSSPLLVLALTLRGGAHLGRCRAENLLNRGPELELRQGGNRNPGK